jgi:hypothetical protein
LLLVHAKITFLGILDRLSRTTRQQHEEGRSEHGTGWEEIMRRSVTWAGPKTALNGARGRVIAKRHM